MAKKAAKKEVRKSNIPVKKEVKTGDDKVYIIKAENTVLDIAQGFGISNAVLIKKLMQYGMMASVNQTLDRETIELLALDFNVKVEDEVITDATRYDEIEIVDDPKDLVKRPPIITIMGHVDHGKTTLLDAIRKARVVEGEAGGITQHIGAYQVNWNGDKITFIDTPGHAAFTEMRARGAKVTDICILVVAADDGVMPQTVEALEHAKAAKVPIIVAVNKVDKPTANPENVMNELSNYDLLPEAWGGKTPYVMVSALKRQGLDELLDVILLLSEIEEYKANPNRLAKGTIIEASLDKSRGPVATFIVETGTLKVGDIVVAGNTYGKVRTMTDDLKRRYEEAGPASPVEVTGLNTVPQAGDIFMAFSDEKTARQIAATREARDRENERKFTKAKSLDSMFSNLEDTEKVLNIVLKGDVQGSIEALKGMLAKIDIDGFHANLVRAGVGAISESDVTLAKASDAILIGFNVRPNAAVRSLAENEGVELRLYNVVYRIIEDIEKALKGMLEPTFEEVVTGQIEVRETFKVSKIGTIAGCYVTDGYVAKDALVRVVRDGIVVYEGKLASLKRFKDDVKEVRKGFECGLSVEDFNDIKVGDIIEASKLEEVEA
ncbi:Translation initiation factor IF-2 [Alteracholeplasma palmae J233]|uniref:Translation initiation factor IF-2 n=1 Tax=Alteracholeplasma palmae (strain ATCC 49389 / J233) TaxID=1318466 RepID=U4KRC1_ALTPJ|nr:translation initiation factor IF-2 [Alteracholeplasma palmae]CCV64031.1 Translation initiation factor IF-2 [Alteracholeplasma palmae J233]